MAKHTVKQGECISSIAYKYGFLPDTLLQEAKNSELMQSQRNPDILYPGDVINIPEKKYKIKSIDTEKKYIFVRKGLPAYLKLRLLDDEQQPRANMDYTLSVDSVTITDTTDDDGYIDKPIPPDSKQAILKLEINKKTEVYEIPLGHIDPIEKISGIQERLHNLGYDCGNIDGEFADKTRMMMKHFQCRHELEETDEINDETRQKLLDLHGS